jgi:hypothetical protein
MRRGTALHHEAPQQGGGAAPARAGRAAARAAVPARRPRRAPRGPRAARARRVCPAAPPRASPCVPARAGRPSRGSEATAPASAPTSRSPGRGEPGEVGEVSRGSPRIPSGDPCPSPSTRAKFKGGLGPGSSFLTGCALRFPPPWEIPLMAPGESPRTFVQECQGKWLCVRLV